jgi:hypothetical protein
MLGNAGVGKRHIAQAIGMAAIHAGFHVLSRDAHVLFEGLVLADAIGERASAIRHTFMLERQESANDAYCLSFVTIEIDMSSSPGSYDTLTHVARHLSKKLAVSLVAVSLLAACSASDSKATDDDSAPQGDALQTKVRAVVDAPFKITSCESVKTTTTDPSGNQVPHLWVNVKTASASSKTIVATQTEFILYDGFGKRVERTEGLHTLFSLSLAGDIEPGDDNQPANSATFDDLSQTTGQVVCQPLKAQFKDGSSWDAPDSDGG